MNPEGNELRISSREIAKLATAVTQMGEQVRQIKILILIYAVASLFLTIASGVFVAMTSPFADEQEDEAELSEAEAVGPSEGDPLPPISLPDANGRVWSNRDLDDKVVLLNFWATWCGPCRREMPIFDQMQWEYESRGFTVLAVSLDREGWDVVRPYISELKPSYPVFVADEGVEREFGKITSLPTTYFVGRDGMIDTEHVGGLSRSHIVKHIESLLEGRTAKETDDNSRPRMSGFVFPEFSKEERDAELEGSVELEVRVHKDGSVHDIKVLRGLEMELDQRVVEAVREARFEPARKAGKPISSLMRIRVRRNVTRTVRPHDSEQ